MILKAISRPIAAAIVMMLLSAVWPGAVLLAETYVVPSEDTDVVGRITQVRARAQDTLADIARRYNIGYAEIKFANPDVDSWLPGEGTRVILPKRFILPSVPREGIVLNLAEMRLYYFPKPQSGEPQTVQTHPVSIGRNDWQTPLGLTKVVSKRSDPTWTPPKSIKIEHAEQGDPLPDVVPPGPDNPLGKFALRLGLPGYLIHGTNKPFGIGMKVSHGCVRMFPEDIELLYNSVGRGTPVHIINEPWKVGWLGDKLYVESHHYFDFNSDSEEEQEVNYTPLVEQLLKATRERDDIDIDWDKTRALASNSRGIPFSVPRKSQ